jgi:O-acetyl-ADP-ribose deacetylase (regulator of RNase III)
MSITVIEGDIWDYFKKNKIVIPVNLVGPMGKGLAKQAKDLFPGLEMWWKKKCKEKNDILFELTNCFIMFPTKFHWRQKDNLDLIEENLKKLRFLNDYYVLPRIGCGCGELDWESQVKPLVEKYLPEKRCMIVIPTESVLRKYK